jgi:hypothetical protein
LPSILGLNSIYSNTIYIIDAPMRINISLVRTIISTQGGILNWGDIVSVNESVIKATIKRSLSASGSSTIPKGVVWLYRLAMNPSIASVITAIRKMTRGRLAKNKCPSR